MRKILLLVIISIFILIGTGFFLWNMTHKTDTKPLPGALTAEELLEYTVETEEITTNIKSGGFAQLKFQIQGDSVKAKEELINRMFQIRHIIILTVSSLGEDELKGAKGITQMEQSIQEQINQIMQDGKVLKIFTTKKLIQ